MVSVIIPTYNRSNELPRAIESVLDQTYKNWELIIIDDGSKDTTNEVVRSYVETHQNIFYYKFLNMGAGIARNIGVSLSKGELIAFLDSDDIWSKNRLMSVYQVYKEERNDSKFYFTDFRNDITTGSQLDAELLRHRDVKEILFAINFLGGTSNLVVPRKVFHDINGFDPVLTSTEDHELYVRLFAQHELAYVPGEVAINFIEAANRISGKNKRRLFGQLMYYKKHKENMSSLSRLMVMKKNALLAYYIKSPVFFKYLHSWIFVWLLQKIYKAKDAKELFFKDSFFIKFLMRN